MAVTREDFVTQAVQDYLRTQLFDVRGYPEDQIEVLESFTGEPFETPITKNWIASGFDFDDGGAQAEMGSTLIKRVYNIEFFVFGISVTWGRNLANAIKFSLENDLAIPLVDITEADRPQMNEVLEVLSVAAQREPIPDPADWQKHCWSVRVRVQDFYDARLT